MGCADGDDTGRHVKTCLNNLASGRKALHILHVNSKRLFDTKKTLYNGREYRLRQTVQRISNIFEAGDTDIIRCVQKKANIAEALTKYVP